MKPAYGIALVVGWFALFVLAFADDRESADSRRTDAKTVVTPSAIALSDESVAMAMDVDLAIDLGGHAHTLPVRLVIDGRGGIAFRRGGPSADTLVEN